MKERKPDMRFKGYEDSWIEKPFGEVFDTLSNNTLSRDKLNYDAGSIMDVHYGDILIKFGEILDTEKEGLPFITNNADAEKYQTAFLRDGDIVIADTAEDETVGKCTEICNVGDKKILSGLHTIPYRSKDGFATGFLGYYLNSGKYHDKLLPLMQGVKVTSISKSGLNETNVIYPKSKKEQALIGWFLFALDEKINSESIVCEKIKILKKAMLGKMFPSNGSRIPEIRFSGFTEPWEQRKLLDISDIVTGTTPPTKDKDNYDGNRLFVSPADIQGNRFIERTITTLTEKGHALGRELRPGTSLFVSIGSTIGKVAQIEEFVTTNQQINAVIPYDKMEDDFVFTMLENEVDKIKKMSAQQAVPIINKSTFGNIEVKYPKKEEQMKIGKYFKELDHLITLHQQKVGKLINIKSACMRRLFV